MKAQLLFTNQSIKVEKSRLKCSSIALYPHVGRPDKYHRHIIEIHYSQPVPRRERT